MLIVLTTIMTVYGIMSIGWPEMTWRIGHVLDARGGEPTDFYVAATRLAGVVALIVAIVLVIVMIVT